MNFISYAQNFEDVILWRALKHIDRGFYVDVGANDPNHDSVTKAFYERGWRGINVEPVTQWFEKLEMERPRDINLKVAAGSQQGELKFFELPDTGLSTLEKSIADQHQMDGGFDVVETVVAIKTLTDICVDFHVAPIHFMKVDVEGAEKMVLDGVDFSVIRPWILVVESTLPLTNVEHYKEWEPNVLSAEYEFVYFDGLNRFYLAKEHQDLKQFFSLPPNYFDYFSLSGGQIFSSGLKADIDAHIDRIRAVEKELSETEHQLRKISDENVDARKCLARVKEESLEAQNRLTTLTEDYNEQANSLKFVQSQLETLQRALDEKGLEAEYWEKRSTDFESELQSVYLSRSWKLTIPMRKCALLVRWLLALPKRCLRWTLLKIMKQTIKYPYFANKVSTLLGVFPKLKLRMKRIAQAQGLIDVDDVEPHTIALDQQSITQIPRLGARARYIYESFFDAANKVQRGEL